MSNPREYWDELAFNANVALPEAQERFRRAEAENKRLREALRMAANALADAAHWADTQEHRARWDKASLVAREISVDGGGVREAFDRA